MNRSHMNTLKKIDAGYIETITAVLPYATEGELEELKALEEQHASYTLYHPDTLKIIGTLHKRKQAADQGIK